MISLAILIGVKLVGLTIFLIVRAAQQGNQPPRPMLPPPGPYPGPNPYNPYGQPPPPQPGAAFQNQNHGYGVPPQYGSGYNAPGHPFGNAPAYGPPGPAGPGGDWPPPNGPQR
jgi:hypothetical protein